jgi:2-isopropylmalate synthase
MPGGELADGSFTGDGPVDAFFSALNAATGHEAKLKEYHVSAVTAGRDALAEVTVLLELAGTLAQGQGVSPDTMEASGRAYLRALANALAESPEHDWRAPAGAGGYGSPGDVEQGAEEPSKTPIG